MVGNSTFPVHLGLLLCEIGHAGGEFFLFWFFLDFFSLKKSSVIP